MTIIHPYVRSDGMIEPMNGGLLVWHDEHIAALAAAQARIGELERERDAYRKAKQENDERFMQERDAARAAVERLLVALEEIAIAEDENGEPESDAAVLRKMANAAIAAGNDGVVT